MPAAVPPPNPERKFQHDVRNIFVDQGFTEVYNYSFISEQSGHVNYSRRRQSAEAFAPLLI